MPKNVVIVEDEDLAAERLIKLIKLYDNNIKQVTRLDSIKNAIAYFENNEEPDLLFLDIQLGDGKSFDIFKSVKLSCHIIFVTAYDTYALQAFKFNSIDYLLKPVKRAELFCALDKFKSQKKPDNNVNDLELVYDKIQDNKKEVKRRFLAKRGSRYFSVESKEVAYVYTRDRMHFIKTISNVDYIIDNNLDDLELQLDKKLFYRANRQFILNYNCIEEVIIWFDGKLKILVKPASPEEIIISRLKSGDFKEWLSS